MSGGRSQFRSTVAVALCVAGLAAYAYFVEFKQRNETAARKEKESLVVQMERAALTRIELHRNSGQVILESSKDGWRMTSPYQDSVDSAQFDSLVDGLLKEKSTDVIAEGEALDWKTYGLDQPVTRLVVQAGERTREVSIGSVKSFDGALYARISEGGKSESRVLLVNQSWDGYLSKPADELRDKRLVRAANLDFDTIAIRRSNGATIRLVSKDGAWSFAAGGDNALPIASDHVNSFVEKLKGLRAVQVVDEDKNSASAAAFGFKGGRAEASVEFFKGGSSLLTMAISRVKPRSVESGASKDEDAYRYAVSSDAPGVFKVYRSALDEIDKDAESFYDRKFPFRVEVDKIQGLELAAEGIALSAKKVDGNWVLSRPDEKSDLASDRVGALIETVARMEVARFRGKTPLRALGGGSRNLRLVDGTGKTVFEMTWGTPYAEKGDPPETKYVDVKTSASGLTFSVPEQAILDLAIRDLVRPKPTPTPALTSNPSTPSQVSKDSSSKNENESATRAN